MYSESESKDWHVNAENLRWDMLVQIELDTTYFYKLEAHVHRIADDLLWGKRKYTMFNLMTSTLFYNTFSQPGV